MVVKYREALRAALGLAREPFDFTLAQVLADALGGWAPMQACYRNMLAGLTREELEHLRALTIRPIDHAALLVSPETSFGHRYAAFMREHALSPTAQVDAYPPIAETFEREWILRRFARVHDMHHLLLGFSADPHGELGLQAFDARNFREPYAFLALASLPVCALRYGDPARFVREVTKGWRSAGAAQNLMAVPFEDMFDLDLDEVRARLGLRVRS